MLPTFILEKRSLLEMYANFMAHPDMFLSITAGTTPEDRMVRFVEYYLTAFHEGRKGAVAKKPYNPVLGESFHCSWEVPRDKVKPLVRSNQGSHGRDPSWAPNNSPQPSPAAEDPNPGGCYRVGFVAEQVSHHPPVSGFYCECRERNMCVNAHVWTKSKFMGMSIGVSMVGEGRPASHNLFYVYCFLSVCLSFCLWLWRESQGNSTAESVECLQARRNTMHPS